MKLLRSFSVIALSAAALVLAGCSSASTSSPKTAYTTTYDLNSGISEIIGYTQGQSTIGASVTLPAPSENDTFVGVGLDSSNNIYTIDKNNVSNVLTCSIVEYAAHAATGATAIKTVTLNVTGDQCGSASGIAVDSAHDYIYFLNYDRTTMRYRLSTLPSSGTLSPDATANVESYWGAYAIDGAGDLFVDDFTTVDAEEITKIPEGFADGYSSQPTILTDSLYDIIEGMYISGNNLYVTGEQEPTGTPINPRVDVFPITATGIPTPTQTIMGSNTEMYVPAAIYADSSGKIYLEDSALIPSTSAYGILGLQYAAAATGNVAPTATTATSNYISVDASQSDYDNAIAVTQ